MLAQHTYYHRMETLLERSLGPAREDQAWSGAADNPAAALLELMAPAEAALN